jgi:hypothetical protein
MSHYKIFQVSPVQIEDEDYITADELQDNMTDGQYVEFADCIDDELDNEEVLDALSLLEGILGDIFYVEGRILTFKGADEFVDKWIAEMKNQLEKVTPKKSLSFWELRKMTTQTHLMVWSRFMWTDESGNDNYPDELGDFVLTCYKNLKPGDKLYVGGIVGFKF